MAGSSPAMTWMEKRLNAPFRRRISLVAAALLAAGVAWAALSFGPSAGPPLPPADQPAETVRTALLARADGEIARVQTDYSDVVVTKRREHLVMSFRHDGQDYTESVANLRDPDDLPLHYTRAMTTVLAYPPEPKRALMIGLGGGSLTTYLGRAMPELSIDALDIDPGVIAIAKRYFGVRESPRLRLIAADGRAFLRDGRERYDLIFVDAYAGGDVPSALQTQEFYALLRDRLSADGAVVLNVHNGTPLYLSTIRTLQSVFAEVRLYPSGRGEVAIIATVEAAPDAATITARAATVQARHNFRFPLPQLVERRTWMPSLDGATVITDQTASGKSPDAAPPDAAKPPK